MISEDKKQVRGHAAALFTAVVWGSTFLASKTALVGGLSSMGLMAIRFSFALLFYMLYRPQCADNKSVKVTKKDELLFLLLGMSGGSVYFFLEYSALQHTSALNVGVITSTVPIVTTAALILMGRARLWWQYVVGTVLAFGGVLMIVFNGTFSMEVHPLGDILAFGDVLMWSMYTILLEHLGKKYSEVFVSRKLFFYALLTLLPVILIMRPELGFEALQKKEVLLPVLYLALVASAACIFLWNFAVNRLGAVKTNMYMYLLTVVPVGVSALLAPDEVTVWKTAGSVMVLAGVMLADYKR